MVGFSTQRMAEVFDCLALGSEKKFGRWRATKTSGR
jgi:hypothetical protein